MGGQNRNKRKGKQPANSVKAPDPKQSQTPTVPIPQPFVETNVPDQKNDTKTEEKEKNSWSKWSEIAIWPVKLNEWILASVAFVALFVGLYTGLFDAMRYHLSGQNERLLTEKSLLEAKKEKVDGEIKQKEAELAEVRRQLTPFIQEARAFDILRDLKKQGIRVRYTLPEDSASYSIAITGVKVAKNGSGKEDFNLIHPILTTINNPYTLDAIQAANEFRSLKALSLSFLELSATHLEAATKHRDLVELVIHHAKVDTKTGSHLRPGASLKNLQFPSNQITSFDGWNQFSDVVTLSVQDNPFKDGGMKSLVKAFPNLVSLHLDGSEVSDDGVNELVSLSKLNFLDLRRTRVTDKCIIKLLDCPNLQRISINKEQITEQIKAILKEKRPNLQLDDRDPTRIDWFA